MALIKRISATLFANLDKAVSTVENHDAIAGAMIDDLRKSTQEAQARLNRVKRSRKEQEQRVSDLHKQIETWKARAVDTAADNRDKAMACLERKQSAEQQHVDAVKSLEEFKVLENKLENNLKQVQKKIDELAKQRELLKSRESVSSAMTTLGSAGNQASNELDDIFDRWEATLGNGHEALDIYDLNSGELDSLEREFQSAEANVALEDELETLLKETRPS